MYKFREEIVKIIDRGNWKSSWHLPKDKNGYIDWFSKETEQRVLKLINEARESGLNLTLEAHSLLNKIEEYNKSINHDKK